MGLGRFGGGLGVTNWLLDQGVNVLLTDLASEKELQSELTALNSHPNLQIICGEHRTQDFSTTDLVVANPAVPQPWNNEFLKAAWESGVTVTTEIQLVAQQLRREQVIGVTGTAGKSTTASMIHAALQASGLTAHLGGNVGGSLLSSLDSINASDVVVLELSSAMLWWLDRCSGWAPHIAVLTTIEENHVDWHGSFEEYVRCKKLIFSNQKEGDISITQDPEASFADLSVLGKHNELNAATAFLAANSMNIDTAKARSGIQSFVGLPHRLQKINDECYNDSKSTTPMATKLAIDAFEDPGKVHVIVGGYDKQIDLTLLAEQSQRVGGMYSIGATGMQIASLATSKVHVCITLDEAVRLAMSSMNEGDVLLLSPGCSSWDQFENYEQRGEQFCELVCATSLRQ
jgi:UDP-N-acetylmuramoylalanine--D-glutamate ligase